jgi:peptide/nickel transport system permease protein
MGTTSSLTLPAITPTATRRQRTLRYLRQNPLFAFGVVIVALSFFLAIFGPSIVPYNPERADPRRISQPPPAIADVPGLIWQTLRGELRRPVNWFGTDAAGLDIYSRVLAAPRTDVLIAMTATIFSVVVGTLLGLIAGYFQNWATEVMMRVSDVIQSFPVFILAMILVALGGRNWINIVIALGFLNIPIYVRLTRSQVLSLRSNAFVEAARAMGNKELIIALRHVLPNALTPSLIQSSVTVGWAILLTAGLSFVGAGVRPPTPEWGLMISTGANSVILGEWWSSIFPGLAISLTVFGFAAIGNTLEQTYGQ